MSGLCIYSVSGFCRGAPCFAKRQGRRATEGHCAKGSRDRIARKRGDAVFLPREFADLGGEDQVLRALRGLVRDGRLVRLGYGVYGRADDLAAFRPADALQPDGFIGAARQALDKLGVEWEPTEAERAYNEGRSTQVPVNPVVRVKGRFRASSAIGNSELVLER